jgi:hypothetical protein
MTPIKFKTTFTNTSDKWLLVGDGKTLIAAYETKEEAWGGVEEQVPSIDDSPYGSVRVMAPGETWQWEGCSFRPFTAAEKTTHSSVALNFIQKLHESNPEA